MTAGPLAGVVTRDDLTPDGSEVIFCGPWLGELGVEMVRWTPYLRSIKAAHPSLPLLAAGYANSACLYRDFADEYWVIDEAYRTTFLNRETSFNYGTLHGRFGNIAYREHAARKGFADSSDVQQEIGDAWFHALEARRLRPAMVVSTLGETRAHRRLAGSEVARVEAQRLLDEAGAASSRQRIVMFLPRLRRLQGEQRSWSPAFYAWVIDALAALPHTTVAALGSRTHEGDLAFAGDKRNVIDLIGAGLDVQLAFWERASLGSGPPSGGLVPGYFTDTPLLHWYKPEQFPTRHGQPWNEVAEPDYEVFGITSEWIDVDESASSISRVVDRIAVRLEARDD